VTENSGLLVCREIKSAQEHVDSAAVLHAAIVPAVWGLYRLDLSLHCNRRGVLHCCLYG
jgi:hypothetical protein